MPTAFDDLPAAATAFDDLPDAPKGAFDDLPDVVSPEENNRRIDAGLDFFQRTHPQPIQGSSLEPAPPPVLQPEPAPPPATIGQYQPPTPEQRLRGVGAPIEPRRGIDFPSLERPDAATLSPFEALQKPTKMPFPRLTTEQVEHTPIGPPGVALPKPIAGVVAGTENAIADVADFMTSGAGVLTAMTGGIAGLPEAGAHAIASQIPKATAYAFATQMAQSLPDQFEQVARAIDRGDTATATRGLLNGALSLGVIGHAAKTAVTPGIAPEPSGGVNPPTEPNKIAPSPGSSTPGLTEAVPRPDVTEDFIKDLQGEMAKRQIVPQEAPPVPTQNPFSALPEAKPETPPNEALARQVEASLNKAEQPPQVGAGELPTREALSSGETVTEPVTEQSGVKPEEGKSVTSIKNAVVDQEREARGLPPAMEPARREFGDVWDEAMAIADDQPKVQDDLIAELREKPRALTDTENALLLQRQIDLQNQYHKEITRYNAAAESGDVATAQEAHARISKLSDDLLDIYNIGKQAGTETGRGLNARKMMAAEDYSLASMEVQKRAANEGKPLTDQQKAEINRLHKVIADTQKAFDEYQSKAELRQSLFEASTNPKIIRVAEQIVGRLDQMADSARARIKERGIKFSAGVDPTVLLDVAQIGAAHLAHIGLDFVKWSAHMISEFGKGIEPHLKDIYIASEKLLDEQGTKFGGRGDTATKAVKNLGEDARLAAYKKRTERRTAEYQERLAKGDFEPRKRTPIRLDEEATRLKANADRAKLEFQRGLMRDRLKQRSLSEKVQDTFIKWRRMFLLSSPVTLAKLTAAAAERMLITPIEEAAGGVVSRFPGISKIADRAPREGGFSVRAEARAMTDGFMNGMSDAWQLIRTGRSNLEIVHGKEKLLPREWTDFMGELHGALKSPAKRNEFERSFLKRVEFNQSKGVDVTDPLVQTRIAQEAYRDANRSIFMQDNRVVSAYKRALSALKEPSKETGRVPLGSRSVATAAEFMLPIVKVPTNIVAETLQYAIGTVTGSARAAAALVRGVEKLSPDEADLIMRQLKKGSLGGALMLAGFLAPEMIGGYYQPGEKRKKEDVKVGSVKIGDTQVPSFLLHNPLLETAQIGATIRRVADSKLRKHDTETQGVGAGLLAGALGLTEEVPFVKEMMELQKAFDPHSRGAFVGELAKSITVPALVQWLARLGDTDATGEEVKRKPTTITEHIKTGIPGLRQEVPNEDQMAAKRKAELRR